MEVHDRDAKPPKEHMTSAAAFVEGGIQEACYDACSICLEEFSDSDPATMTTCRHEFHMQCILEWCQRSSQCPMCWQQISMKDPGSQGLLEAVEQERTNRETCSRNVAIFHHPALGEFEMQHLHVGTNNSDLEERIIQHLAAASAIGRPQHIGRRESHRTRTYANGRPRYLLFSTQSGAHLSAPISASRRNNEHVAINVGTASAPFHSVGNESAVRGECFLPVQWQSSSTVASTVMTPNHQDAFSNNRNSGNHSSLVEDMAGPSDFQSFSESLRSKLSSLSMRYKESISKSTRGWKERLFSRNNSLPLTGSEVRGEMNAGIASLSCTGDNMRGEGASVTNRLDDGSVGDRSI